MVPVDLIRQCLPSNCYAREGHGVVGLFNRQQQAFICLCAASIAVEHHPTTLRSLARDGQQNLPSTRNLAPHPCRFRIEQQCEREHVRSAVASSIRRTTDSKASHRLNKPLARSKKDQV